MSNDSESVEVDNELNKNEADITDDYNIQESKSTSVNCTRENSFESTENQMQANDIDLPQEIDAMKIEQSMQHTRQERTEENPNNQNEIEK